MMNLLCSIPALMILWGTAGGTAVEPFQAYRAAQHYIDTSSAVDAFVSGYIERRFGPEALTQYRHRVDPYDTATTEILGLWVAGRLTELSCPNCTDSQKLAVGRQFVRQEYQRCRDSRRLPIGSMIPRIADTSSRAVVYYSPMYGDTLFAQIFVMRPGRPYNWIRQVGQFTTSMTLVFIFDEHANLTRVSTGTVMYD